MLKKTDHDKQIADLKSQIEDLTNKWKRALADYQNLEKRTAQERIENTKHANEELIHGLLVTLDSLESAEKHLQDREVQELLKSANPKLQAIFDGVKYGANGLLATLKYFGLKRIEVLGKQFDPKEMECVEVIKGEKDDEVVEEVRPGYKLNDKILRVARVKVSKKDVKN